MKHNTAYKIAITAIKKQRALFSCGHVLYQRGHRDIWIKRDEKKYVRFTEAIGILEKESG